MNRLENLESIKKIDSLDMYHKIIHMPEHILNTYNNAQILNFDANLKKEINQIIICGMGGSAIAGDIIESIYKNLIPVRTVKDYNLPFCNEKTLVIACSYSGNTEETLSCLQSALSKTKNIWGVTTGGKLFDMLNPNYPIIQLNDGYPPRSAIAFLFFSLIKVLELEKIIPNQSKDVNKLCAYLMQKAGAIAKSVPTNLNLAKNTAIHIENKIPIIYSANPVLAPIAYRWKCQINENTKYPAFHHTLPEMNHNEIEAWENEKHRDIFIPLILRYFDEKPDYAKRLSVLYQLFNEHNIDYLEFFGDGDSEYGKAFSLIYLGDMISFYLAILSETNPTSINFIDYLKNHL